MYKVFFFGFIIISNNNMYLIEFKFVLCLMVCYFCLIFSSAMLFYCCVPGKCSYVLDWWRGATRTHGIGELSVGLGLLYGDGWALYPNHGIWHVFNVL